MIKKITTYLLLLFSILLLSNCRYSDNEKKDAKIDVTATSNEKEIFVLSDLISFSKAKFGFVKKDGAINEFYGDFDCVDAVKNIFEFNVGCGRSGDIISLIIIDNPTKNNCFDLYIPKGDKYLGGQANSNKKVGEFQVISENEIHGSIKLCLEEGSGCCGEEGENFIMKSITTNSDISSNKEKSFTIKKNKDLPSWFEKADRTYMLNDDRTVENDQIEFIGGNIPNKGEIFFIDNKEVVFSENQIKIDQVKTVITKTLTSGDYIIKITWDTSLTTGAYSEGTISLYYKNAPSFNSSLIISGW